MMPDGSAVQAYPLSGGNSSSQFSENTTGQGAPAAPGAVGAPGLVYYSTMQTRMRRMKTGVITAARLIEQERQRGGFRERCVFVTLTYRPGAVWSPSDVRDYVQRVRSWLERRGESARYVWTVETTKAGVPHYHLLVWLRLGLTLPFADKRGWWPHGMSNQVWARNAVGYIAKYASKGHAGGPVSYTHLTLPTNREV